MALITWVVGYVGKYSFIGAVWGGLVFLALVTGLIHWYIFGPKGTENAVLRRLMVGSMLRMFTGVLFLAITLYNIRPVSMFFVFSYCSYFCLFLVFEIWEMRTNLRPDSKPRPKNENA